MNFGNCCIRARNAHTSIRKFSKENLTVKVSGVIVDAHLIPMKFRTDGRQPFKIFLVRLPCLKPEVLREAYSFIRVKIIFLKYRKVLPYSAANLSAVTPITSALAWYVASCCPAGTLIPPAVKAVQP